MNHKRTKRNKRTKKIKRNKRTKKGGKSLRLKQKGGSDLKNIIGGFILAIISTISIWGGYTEYKYRPVRNLFLRKVDNNEEFINILIAKYSRFTYPGSFSEKQITYNRQISYNNNNPFL